MIHPFDALRSEYTGLLAQMRITRLDEVDAGLRELIGRGASLPILREYAVSRGFRPMSDDAGEKVDWGVTSRDEAFQALYS